MGRLGRSIALCGAAVLVACSGKRSANDESSAAARTGHATRVQRAVEPLFGPNGELLESKQTVAGLRLPRGLTQVRSDGREHVFTSTVDIRKVQRYFGARLMTGQVDRVGKGVIYRGAFPVGARTSALKIDVSILPTSDSPTRVQLVELRPAPKKLNESEVRARLKRDIQRMD